VNREHHLWKSTSTRSDHLPTPEILGSRRFAASSPTADLIPTTPRLLAEERPIKTSSAYGHSPIPIHAWQAKYFIQLGHTQWSNLDESVKTAIAEHSSLKKYMVCLPIDRSTTGDGRKWSQMRRWNAHVVKWKRWATKADLEVDFCYWGSHELVFRLTRDEHTGRRYYLFNQQVFSSLWLEDHVQEAENRAGPRFSAELNIETNARKTFDALARTPDAQRRRRKKS
jgi:hypothetical protein